MGKKTDKIEEVVKINKTKVFQNELSYIRDEEVLGLVKRALLVVNDKFFIVPASSTEKYHPKYALGAGGLVRHTKAAVYLAKEMLSLKQYSHLSITDKSLIIGALILHDTCKNGLNWESEYTIKKHPLLVKYLLKEESENLLWKNICRLVETHMGQWDGRGLLPQPKTELEKIVHLCDYFSSRKNIHIDVEYEVKNEKATDEQIDRIIELVTQMPDDILIRNNEVLQTLKDELEQLRSISYERTEEIIKIIGGLK